MISRNRSHAYFIEFFRFKIYNVTMRIGIIEDNQSQSENLKNMILSLANHEITIFHSGEEFLFECEDTYPFDVLFLDIQLDQMNGIELARKIREKDKNVQIIFLTAILDYVLEGYEVNAIRYLLKPIEKEKCAEVLSLVENNITKDRTYLFLNNTKIYLDEIYYIESCGHYCEIVGEHKINVKIALGKLEKMLDANFIACHRSYIVNMNYVESVFKDHCVIKNKEIPVSRSLSKKVQNAFLKQVKEGMIMS